MFVLAGPHFLMQVSLEAHWLGLHIAPTQEWA